MITLKEDTLVMNKHLLNILPTFNLESLSAVLGGSIGKYLKGYVGLGIGFRVSHMLRECFYPLNYLSKSTQFCK